MTPAGTVGLVLAAGASSRMGQPKALLTLPGGSRLADSQCTLLRDAGCDHAWILLGADADRIGDPFNNPVLINPDWESGRITTIQCGLRSHADAAAYLVLPVDTVGVKKETIQQLLAHPSDALFLRPAYHGKSGHILRVSPEGRDMLLNLPVGTDVKVMEKIRDMTELMKVDDAAVLNNINTPEEWNVCRRGI